MSYLTTKLVNRLSVGVIFIVMIIKYILLCTMNECGWKIKGLYHLVLVIYLDAIHKTCHTSMSVHV